MFLSAFFSVCVYFSLVVSQKCPENARYSDCGCLLTCDSPFPSEECEESCQPGCYCEPGYLYRNDGVCVLHKDCDQVENTPKTQEGNYQYQCGADEQYYQCSPSCKNTCENHNNPEARCKCGPPHCFCREGLVKRKDEKCVPPRECQVARGPPQCPENSVYIACGSACAPTCKDPQIRSCGDKCVRACYCKPGYLTSRDGNGCVRPEHCDLKEIPELLTPKCPENAVFIMCGSACPPTCQNNYPEPCSEECVTACFCKPGYLMNVNGSTCVRPDQCEKTKSTPANSYNCTENAVYQDCGTSCPPTCEQPNPEQCSLECVTGCFCKPGFLKRKDGKCVLSQQCQVKEKCRPDEQYYECTPSCKNNCKNYHNPGIRCACGPPGCFCREGLITRADGKCVPPNQCPKKCRPDEQYYECTPSCKNTCLNYNNPGARCGCGPPGCFCKEGLVKRADGICVEKKHCPITPPKCVENAVFTPCGSSCPPTCESPRPPLCSQRCEAGCFCKPGFLKTKEDKCVTPDQCRTKNQTECCENAEFNKCGPACPETCENTQPPKPCIQQCVAECFCKPGFVKTRDEKCVPPNLCDKNCSLPEEEYLECGSTCPDTCDNRGRPPSTGCPKMCNRGCFCKKGLFRNYDGTCVPIKDCPPEIPPPNTNTTTSGPETGVTFGESRGCPDQKLCETFCKSHQLNIGHCVGQNKKECHCS